MMPCMTLIPSGGGSVAMMPCMTLRGSTDVGSNPEAHSVPPSAHLGGRQRHIQVGSPRDAILLALVSHRPGLVPARYILKPI